MDTKLMLLLGAGTVLLLGGGGGSVGSGAPRCARNPVGARDRDFRAMPASERTELPGYAGKPYTMTRQTASDYRAMVAAARRAGFPAPLLEVVSAYRDDENQTGKWTRKVASVRAAHPDWSEGQIEDEAAKWVAPPGHSKHRTGRALDLWLGMGVDSDNVRAMKALPIFKWLVANAGKFGFVNYTAEPWHWENRKTCGDSDLSGLGRFNPVTPRVLGEFNCVTPQAFAGFNSVTPRVFADPRYVRA